jgi:hypothetical protein
MQKLPIEGILALNSTRQTLWSEYVSLNENITTPNAIKSPDAKKQKADLSSKLNSLSTEVAKGNVKFWQLVLEFQHSLLDPLRAQVA